MILIHDCTIFPEHAVNAKIDSCTDTSCYLTITYDDGRNEILRYQGEHFLEQARRDLNIIFEEMKKAA